MSAAALGALPALPLHTAGKYVAGAYIVAFVLVLVYVAIMAMRLGKIERELDELVQLAARERTASGERAGGAAEERTQLEVEEREGSPV